MKHKTQVAFTFSQSRRLAFGGRMCGWLFAVVLAFTGFAAQTQAAPNRVIHVDDDAALGGDGSAASPYNNLADALADARATSAAVVINVAPGDYAIDSPLVIDRSLELRGASVLIEDTDGWPTGAVEPATETRIVGTEALGTQPVVAVGRPDGVIIDDVRIRGFVFYGTPGGIEVYLTRVQNYTVDNNAFRGPAVIGLQSIASSGRVAGNHFTGVGTGAMLAGGYPESPSMVTFAGNRSVNNRLGGLLLNGASTSIPELGDRLEAAVRDNDLSHNTSTPNPTFGIRLFILPPDLGSPGDSQSTGNIKAEIRGNRIVGNEIGICLDAGFPSRRVGGTCDTRIYSGTIELRLEDNTLTGSLLTPALLTFTRSSAALNPALLPVWQYLHGATFTITDRQGTLDNALVDHPALDPLLGPCAGDSTNEPLGNILRYNGVDVPNGRNF